MHVAIVGAGVAGLSTASTLLAFGHTVTIFDTAPSVGGVWSPTRHYPGLKTQNSRDTYAFSTLPMSKEYPRHPDGRCVQEYLEDYVRANALDKEDRLRLGTDVVKATPHENGWVLEVCTNGTITTHSFAYLIVATGVFNVPYIPSISGSEAFTASGGRIVHTSTFHNLKDIEDKHVLVLGFGKSACDAAVAVSRHARSTTLIARDVTWKLPTYIGGALHYSYLFLTRMGEALFPYIRPSPAQRFLSFGFGKPIRALLLGGLTKVIRTQLQLDRLGLLPRTPFETIARSDISLATPDFVEAATTGKLAIERGASITSMSEGWVVLSNRKVLPANVIICGTGWSHSIPSFLPSDLKSTLLDENGDWMLYRHVLPPGVPRLAFAGFASSLFCPLTSEVTALWLAAHLESSPDLPLLRLPPPDEQKSLAQEQARWLRARTAGKHANATSITPFSMSHIDELLDDMDVRIGWWPRLREWLLPVDPTAYQNLLPTMIARRDQLRDQTRKAA